MAAMLRQFLFGAVGPVSPFEVPDLLKKFVRWFELPMLIKRINNNRL